MKRRVRRAVGRPATPACLPPGTEEWSGNRMALAHALDRIEARPYVPQQVDQYRYHREHVFQDTVLRIAPRARVINDTPDEPEWSAEETMIWAGLLGSKDLPRMINRFSDRSDVGRAVRMLTSAKWRNGCFIYKHDAWMHAEIEVIHVADLLASGFRELSWWVLRLLSECMIFQDWTGEHMSYYGDAGLVRYDPAWNNYSGPILRVPDIVANIEQAILEGRGQGLSHEAEQMTRELVAGCLTHEKLLEGDALRQMREDYYDCTINPLLWSEETVEGWSEYMDEMIANNSEIIVSFVAVWRIVDGQVECITNKPLYEHRCRTRKLAVRWRESVLRCHQAITSTRPTGPRNY